MKKVGVHEGAGAAVAVAVEGAAAVEDCDCAAYASEEEDSICLHTDSNTPLHKGESNNCRYGHSCRSHNTCTRNSHTGVEEFTPMLHPLELIRDRGHRSFSSVAGMEEHTE